MMAREQHRLPLSGLLVAAAIGLFWVGPAMGQQANQQPVAAATATPTTGSTGTFIFLDGSTSSDPDGTIVSYSWDFGDSTPVVSGDAGQAGAVYHSYGSDGAYTVTLTVTDDQGATSDPAGPTATVLIAIGAGTTTTSTTTTTTVPGATANGASVYSSSCSACHGAVGQGGLGPSLQTSLFGQGATVSVVVSGVGVMPGFSGSLSQAEIDAVSAYSVGLQTSTGSTTSTTTTTTVPGATVSGRQLYSSSCSACHGAVGQGGLGPSLQTTTFGKGATISVITNGAGVMPGYSGSLSKEEISAVASYSLRFKSSSAPDTNTTTDTTTDTTVATEDTGNVTPNPTADIYASSCSACHGALGEGGIGPSLQISILGFDASLSAISSGVGAMPGFSTSLSSEQIEAITAYSVAFQSADAAGAPAGDETPLPDETPADGANGGPLASQGPELFAANCAACHGTVGQGGLAAPINVPFGSDQLIEIIRLGIGNMPGFDGGLDDDQIAAVAAYVQALSAQSTPTTTLPPTGAGYIVAIQPSKYAELDSDRTSVPLEPRTQLGIALASMALLGLLAYGEVRKTRSTSVDGGRHGDS